MLLQIDNSLPHLVFFYDAIGLTDISIIDPDKKVTLKSVTFPTGRPEVRQKLLLADDSVAREQLVALPRTHTDGSIVDAKGLFLSRSDHARVLTEREAICNYASGAVHVCGAEAVEQADAAGLVSGRPMQHAVQVRADLLLDARASKAGSANSGGHCSDADRICGANNAELCVHPETGSACLRVRKGYKICASAVSTSARRTRWLVGPRLLRLIGPRAAG